MCSEVTEGSSRGLRCACCRCSRCVFCLVVFRGMWSRVCNRASRLTRVLCYCAFRARFIIHFRLDRVFSGGGKELAATVACGGDKEMVADKIWRRRRAGGS